jgi:hypothetical protein
MPANYLQAFKTHQTGARRCFLFSGETEIMKLHLLPFLAALAWAASVFTAPSASASPSPSPPPILHITEQNIYAGSLQNGWQYWGWGTAALANPSPALSENSIKAQEDAWQAVYLHHAPQQTNSKMLLTFWVNGGPTGGQSLVVKATRNGIPQTPVVLGTLRARLWQQIQISLPKLGVGSVPDMDGLWIQNNSAKAAPVFYVDKITLNGVNLPVPPAAPAGLTATPLWTASCPVCGGMAMAHVVLNWNAVPGASAYTVYRNGVKCISQDAPGWTDMSVTSGQAYSYAVTATGPGGESVLSASVSATAPSPPVSVVTTQSALTAPVNLAVQGVWLGAATDSLAWSPVPGAVSYNVYQYGTLIAKNLTVPSYTVPASVWWNGMTYTVTAVDLMGMESLPSAPATAQGGLDPSQAPVWSPAAPAVPYALAAVPEWNAGRPRLHLTWHGTDTDVTYNVYRDGQPVAAGLWGLNYYDQNVQPGETHSYTVTGANVVWTRTFESDASASLTATAPASPPLPSEATVQITNIAADDDSALISFAAVPGAVDYRVYDIANPNSVKYSGGSLSIQANGFNPAGATVIVEAVDKLGPFEAHGMAMAGAAPMAGMASVSVNGQGDPSNVPNVLAASAPTVVTFTPRTLAGSQVFFDNFQSENPLVAQPIPAPIPGDNGGEYGCPTNYSVAANDKWEIRNYAGDLANSQAFFMGNHFMDVLYDGGTAHFTPVMHNNNASVVLMPKATADISGGKVLHVTMEVDAHFDSRRWCDIVVAPASDTFINPGKLDGGLWPTTSGNMFRWQIEGHFHLPEVYRNNVETQLVDVANGINSDGPNVQRDNLWVPNVGPVGIGSNGSTQDLDKRHQFDLYLSQTHFRIYEAGQLVKDADLPAGQSLPFDQCQVYFVHEVYHTGNDRPEQVNGSQQQPDAWNDYWYNYCPWSDERHWDNLGESVLDSFPPLS